MRVLRAFGTRFLILWFFFFRFRAYRECKKEWVSISISIHSLSLFILRGGLDLIGVDES